MRAAGKDEYRPGPNIVMGANAQVALEKFARCEQLRLACGCDWRLPQLRDPQTLTSRTALCRSMLREFEQHTPRLAHTRSWI